MKSFLYNKSFWMKFQKRLTAKLQPSVIEANGEKKNQLISLNTLRMVSNLKNKKTQKTTFPKDHTS